MEEKFLDVTEYMGCTEDDWCEDTVELGYREKTLLLWKAQHEHRSHYSLEFMRQLEVARRLDRGTL